jgi:hypothetical protein
MADSLGGEDGARAALGSAALIAHYFSRSSSETAREGVY